MHDLLKAICEANGWVFFYGRSDFQELFDEIELINTPHIILDPQAYSDVKNDNGDIETRIYTGSFILGISSSIDEPSYESRYQDYIKGLCVPASNLIESTIKCLQGFRINLNNNNEIINTLGYNFDGLVIDYTLTVDKDKLTLPDELGLELEAQTGGIVEPYEGLNTYPPLSNVAINAVANDGYTFQWWSVNGAKVLDKLTIVSLNQYKKAVAYFIRFFTLNISSVGNGSTVPATGSYEHEEGETVQIEAIPDENNQFENFDDNGTIITDNPYFPVMNSLKNVVANFIALISLKNTISGDVTNILTDFGYNNTSNFNPPQLDGYDNIICAIAGQSNAATIIVTDLLDVPTDLQPYLSKVYFKTHTDATWLSPSDKINATQPLVISELYYSLNLAKLTGKNVYIARTAIGNTGFENSSGDGRWKVSSNDLALRFVTNINDGKALISGNTYALDLPFNGSEFDAEDTIGADSWKPNFSDFYQYVITQTGYTFRPILFQLNELSYAVYTQEGSIVNNSRIELVNRPNDPLYLGDSILQTVNEFETREDRVHYSADTYKEMYTKTAELSYNKLIDNQLSAINNNPSIRMSGTVNFGSIYLNKNFYNIGAKCMWVKFTYKDSALDRDIFRTENGTNGLRFKFNPGQNFPIVQIYQNGATTLSFSGVQLIDGGTYCLILNWDGTTNTDSFQLITRVISGDKSFISSATKTTPTDVETLGSTFNFVKNRFAPDQDIFEYGSVNRALSDSELENIYNHNSQLINDVDIYTCSEGYGTALYSSKGNRANVDVNVQRFNNGFIPWANTIDGYELQVDGSGNYRHVPNGITGTGWTKVEDIDKTKWYDVLGSTMSLPEHYKLREFDYSNLFFDADGVAQDVSGTQLRGLVSDSIITEIDDYGISEIKIYNSITE